MSVPPAPWEGGIAELAMLQAAMSEAHLILVRRPMFILFFNLLFPQHSGSRESRS